MDGMHKSPERFRLTGRVGLALAVLFAWLLFLIVDYRYQLVIENKSELYGPLSFFQPVLKYLTFVLTAAYVALSVLADDSAWQAEVPRNER